MPVTQIPTGGLLSGWRDITSDIQVRGVGANDPSYSIYAGTNMRGFSFSPSAMNEVFMVFHIPHDYILGSVFHFHTHWSNPAVTPNTGNVLWGFEYTYAKGYNQESFPSSTTVSVVQGCPSSRYRHMISETTPIAIPTMEIDGIILVRVYSDGGNVLDTCTDSVYLHTADIHYQSNSMSTVNKNVPFYS